MGQVAILLMALSFAAVAGAHSTASSNDESDAMAAARAALKKSHGDQMSSLVLGERFELHSDDDDPMAVWEGQGWIGGDVQKLWIKTEGEYETEAGRFEEAELQALYSRAVSPFWDLQVGFRHDVRPGPARTYAVVGAQGLAPYWFELDGALFISEKGDLSARVEAEYELRLTQRLILQPRVELNAALSDDAAVGIGSGLSAVTAGLRLRYEVTRELAPYVGVSWEKPFGKTRGFARADDELDRSFSWVAGVRFWF